MTLCIALLAVAATFVATPARADADVPTRPERIESAEKPPSRIRLSLALGGFGLTAGFWALNTGFSYLFPDQPGFDRLRTPVIGPWQALANNDCRGSCSFINYFNFIYFTFSGLAQAGGLGLAIEALVTPTATPRARQQAPAPNPLPGPRTPERAPPSEAPPSPSDPPKPLFYLPMPSPIGEGGVGVSFGGIF
ncbi:MAG: hypothetical protein NZX77_15435 [Polyangiaceae bacterium]|nr:hypothetical protein [Polyangiaceae bacterium]